MLERVWQVGLSVAVAILIGALLTLVVSEVASAIIKTHFGGC